MDPDSDSSEVSEDPEELKVRRERLHHAVEHAAHLLPAQGPIPVFVHHNTLHAFEDLPFEKAVVTAGKLFDCEPYLTEEKYRAKIERGRILEHDVKVVLEEDLGPLSRERVGPWATRFDIRLAVLRKGITVLSGTELEWKLAETGILDRLRADLDPEPRRLLIERARTTLGRDVPLRRLERLVVRDLWDSCLRAVSQVPGSRPASSPAIRHRDLLLDAAGVDSDDLVHPVLIRMCSAFLDQGIAYWPMPGRDMGFFPAVLALYGQPGGPPETWLKSFQELACRCYRSGTNEVDTILASLEELGVAESDWDPFVTQSLVALRGWAGMVNQIETRPDRVPVHAPKASLMGFLAVRLLLERAALAFLARERLEFTGKLSDLRQELLRRVPPPTIPEPEERAFSLFQLAQILGRGPGEIRRLSPSSTAALLRELEIFPTEERQRLLHLAYERRHLTEVLDGLGAHVRAEQPKREAPAFQAVFCIDDREESMRRHVEEVEPAAETFGVAGFFGVTMYYRGAGDAHPRPLCPVAFRPEVEVVERVDPERQESAHRRARSRRTFGRLIRGINISSRSFARGTILTALFGSLAAIPLIVRVLFPRVAARFRKHTGRLVEPPEETFLAIERDEARPPTLGKHSGFSKAEMAAIVKRQLEDIGLTRGFAPVVLIAGHGSSSLNNPHESAYECGACGGGAGGPNARAFTRMANDPAVRELLASEGLEIPASTLFVGVHHNTCDDSITFFDSDDIPAAFAESVGRVRKALEEACTRNAHERCRRFESAPTWYSPAMALSHVERRSHDLAQPRPELGHATNAVAVVGRRSRTAGLFLDRRAFLVSYDPEQDDEAGTILGRLLAAVAPVGAGINLEYYFSHVDSAGYGCGSKLPHNLTGLIGVMDGFQSDLRSGLPWQMVEIHEPVRLLMILETRPEALLRATAKNPDFGKLVRNGWVRLALLDPDTDEIRVLSHGELRRHEPESDDLAVVTSSMEWYRGRRGDLPCARIERAPEAAQ